MKKRLKPVTGLLFGLLVSVATQAATPECYEGKTNSAEPCSLSANSNEIANWSVHEGGCSTDMLMPGQFNDETDLKFSSANQKKYSAAFGTPTVKISLNLSFQSGSPNSFIFKMQVPHQDDQTIQCYGLLPLN